MTTYAIGDVQGCYDALLALLDKIHFDPQKDVLWFTGDLVNRGPKSLQVLRFIKALGDQHKIVLGNHDLHLLAIYYGVRSVHPHDTLAEILQAPDCDELMFWLRHQVLLHHEHNFVLLHAGLSPNWSVDKVKLLAKEVEAVLQSESIKNFLQHMYGNLPDKWDDQLTGFDRLRCITNFLTRVRLCTRDGHMDFAYKGELAKKPAHLIPWFDLPRQSADANIIFGHWAALNGESHHANIFALDTGCVWGNCLTAMRLQDQEKFFVKCTGAGS